ncbi:MAG: S8 family serine peptidase [Polyangiaceae bacterium]
MAPGARLIIAAPSSSEGFHDPDILNAASFIFAAGEKLGLPTVINLSVGGDFGPHDGTSILEKSLAAMVGEDHPGRAIVVASGNSGALYLAANDGPLGIHTEARVSDHGTTRVPILTPKAKNGQGYVWITFNPDDEVSVGLEGPGGSTWVDLVDPGEDGGYDEDGTTGAVINRLVNGKSELTSDTNGAVVAWDGSWDAGEMAILLRGKGTAQLWVVGQGDVSASHGGLYFRRAIKQGTINVPATHPELIGVGCTVNRVSWTPFGSTPLELSELGGEKDPTPDGICYFSSAGPLPSGWPKPDLSAPGGFVAAAMSHDADPRVTPGSMFDVAGCPDGEHCYLVDNYHAITSGSSMSSPQVAGAAALLLQRDPSLTQRRVREILQAGARYPSHPIPYDYQLGPGELDLVGALAAMGPDENPDGLGPDPVLSWTMLSSAYARPDPSWPVWGTVELRRADNSLASGLSDTRVGLRVKNGRVVSPLARVRHGLWRFAVAGEHGTAGETLELEVTYDGKRIGYARALHRLRRLGVGDGLRRHRRYLRGGRRHGAGRQAAGGRGAARAGPLRSHRPPSCAARAALGARVPADRAQFAIQGSGQHGAMSPPQMLPALPLTTHRQMSSPFHWHWQDWSSQRTDQSLKPASSHRVMQCSSSTVLTQLAAFTVPTTSGRVTHALPGSALLLVPSSSSSSSGAPVLAPRGSRSTTTSPPHAEALGATQSATRQARHIVKRLYTGRGAWMGTQDGWRRWTRAITGSEPER